MAMPRPASDRMEMDFATMAGICTFHLKQASNSSKLDQQVRSINKTQMPKLMSTQANILVGKMY